MSEPFIGEIKMVGFNYAPSNWANCDGQLLSISQNQSLYMLFKTYYGGDGMTTFGLPDFRDRVPMHQGKKHAIGEKGGHETVTITDSAEDDVENESGGRTVSVMQPYQVVNFVVALQGVFPPRND